MSSNVSLYKYVSSTAAIEAMLGGSLKICPINELNDPAELFPAFAVNEVKDSLARMRSRPAIQQDLLDLREQANLMNKLSPENKMIRSPRSTKEFEMGIRSRVYNDMSTMKRHLSSTADRIRSRSGVLSLTANPHSLPMWAHYASNATGGCVAFRDLHMTFKGDETGLLSKVLPVRYSTPRPGITFEPSSHRNLFLSKFADWEYEQEYRVIMALKDCVKTADGLFLHHIPAVHIEAVICGWNMSDEDRNLIVQMCHDTNPDVEVRGIKMASDGKLKQVSLQAGLG